MANAERLKTEPVDLTINPDVELEDGELVAMIRDVKDSEKVPNRAKIRKIFNGVSEAKP